MTRTRWVRWLLAVLAGLMGGAPAMAQTVARGVETFPAGTLRLVPAAGVPSTALCGASTAGLLLPGGGGATLYLCDGASWVDVGAGAAGAVTGTTAATFTLDTDAAVGASTTTLELDAGDGAAVQTATIVHDGAAGTLTLALPGGAVVIGGYDVGSALATLTTGTTGAAAVTWDDSVMELGAANVQAAVEATVAVVGEHQETAMGAHAASAISVADAAGTITATNVEGALAEHTLAIVAAQSAADGAQADAEGAAVDAGIADALAESLATDRVCRFDPAPHFDGTDNNITWSLPSYDATDRETYVLGTDNAGAQDSAYVDGFCVPQRDPALTAARVTYRVTGTMQVVLTVVDSGGSVCATSAAGTSTTKAALSAGDTSSCVTTAGEPVLLHATCSGGAATDTCRIGHRDVSWAR